MKDVQVLSLGDCYQQFTGTYSIFWAEEDGIKYHQNICAHLPSYRVSHPRRQQS
jgi:hypothetical protein